MVKLHPDRKRPGDKNLNEDLERFHQVLHHFSMVKVEVSESPNCIAKLDLSENGGQPDWLYPQIRQNI